MKINRVMAGLLFGSLLAFPVGAFGQRSESAQEAHDRAVREQTASDHRHHTGAKIVGGSAAGGAVVGALAGGGKGALIGGAVGAGGGAIANKVRKDNDVKKRERRDEYHFGR
jgi:uncharacterized protein YcfJ